MGQKADAIKSFCEQTCILTVSHLCRPIPDVFTHLRNNKFNRPILLGGLTSFTLQHSDSKDTASKYGKLYIQLPVRSEKEQREKGALDVEGGDWI